MKNNKIITFCFVLMILSCSVIRSVASSGRGSGGAHTSVVRFSEPVFGGKPAVDVMSHQEVQRFEQGKAPLTTVNQGKVWTKPIVLRVENSGQTAGIAFGEQTTPVMSVKPKVELNSLSEGIVLREEAVIGKNEQIHGTKAVEVAPERALLQEKSFESPLADKQISRNLEVKKDQTVTEKFSSGGSTQELSFKKDGRGIEKTTREDGTGYILESATKTVWSGLKKKTFEIIEITQLDVEGKPFLDSKGNPVKLSLSITDYKEAFKKAQEKSEMNAVVDSMILDFINKDQVLMEAIKTSSVYKEFSDQMVEKVFKDINKPSMASEASFMIKTGIEMIAEIQWSKLLRGKSKLVTRPINRLITEIDFALNSVLIAINKKFETKFDVHESRETVVDRLAIQRLGSKISKLQEDFNRKEIEISKIETQLATEGNTLSPSLKNNLKENLRHFKDYNARQGIEIQSLMNQRQNIMGQKYDVYGHEKSNN